MSGVLVVEDVPSRLVRVWEKPEHLDAFLSGGHLRLWRIQYYRTIESDTRADEAEGEAHLLIPGDVPQVVLDRRTGEIVERRTAPGHFNWSMTFTNPTYVLCLADAVVDLPELSRRFGTHIAEVFAPIQLLQRLHEVASFSVPVGREVVSVEAFSVRYDKGMVGVEPTNSRWRARIAYGQKDPRFASELEYRCAVVLSGPSEDAPPYLDLTLGSVAGFARHLQTV